MIANRFQPLEKRYEGLKAIVYNLHKVSELKVIREPFNTFVARIFYDLG